MIKSKYISDILELLLDGDSEGLALKSQLPFLEEDDFEYTGSGVFIGFKHLSGIEDYKFHPESIILNGVIIKSTSLGIEADATVFVTDGFIDFLEIWCYDGKYPDGDLKDYVLKQVWIGSAGKETKGSDSNQ